MWVEKVLLRRLPLLPLIHAIQNSSTCEKHIGLFFKDIIPIYLSIHAMNAGATLSIVALQIGHKGLVAIISIAHPAQTQT